MPAPRATRETRERGQRLKGLRVSLGLTQREVSGRLEMSEDGYAAHERGYASMSAADIPRFASALGVTAGRLAEALGFIEQRPIESIQQGNQWLVPMAEVLVAGGVNSWSPTGSGVLVDDDLARGRDLVAFRVTGDCMAPEISDGSLVFVNRAEMQPQSGDIVVVITDDGPMIKRYVVNKGDPALIDNKGGTFKPDGAQIVGVVRESRKRH